MPQDIDKKDSSVPLMPLLCSILLAEAVSRGSDVNPVNENPINQFLVNNWFSFNRLNATSHDEMQLKSYQHTNPTSSTLFYGFSKSTLDKVGKSSKQRKDKKSNLKQACFPEKQFVPHYATTVGNLPSHYFKGHKSR